MAILFLATYQKNYANLFNKKLTHYKIQLIMQEITVAELKALKDSNADFQLIDVRETHEIEIATIGGEHIPMGEIMDNLDKISEDKHVIVMCRSGARSASVCNALTANGFENVSNLTGGILAWANAIDSSMEKY